MSCEVCKGPSLYIYRITDKIGINYCDGCLPKFLVERKKAGLLETTDGYKSAVEEGLKNITTTPAPVEDTAPVVEELAPVKKKAASKKAE